MKALSIRQPWAWLIAQGWKNIENRTWPARYRGPCLVHAAKGMTRGDYEACEIFIRGWGCTVELPAFAALERGGIVGVMTISGCVTSHPSEWFTGPYGFVVSYARPLPFMPLKGALGFFEVDVPAPAAVPCNVPARRLELARRLADLGRGIIA